MGSFLDSISGALLERTAAELIGGVFLALLLALAAAWAFAATRRTASDATMLLAVLILVGNLAGMVLAVGYVRMDRDETLRAKPDLTAEAPRLRQGPSRDLVADVAARAVLAAGDADGNGSLSPDEAAAAALRFVREAEVRTSKPVDWPVISLAIKGRMGDLPLPHPDQSERDRAVRAGATGVGDPR